MIPHNKLTLGIEEKEAVTRVLNSGWLAEGMEVEAFENELCEFLELPAGHAVALSSGTAALYMALRALNAARKTVGFPVYVCSAVRNAVGMAGGRELLLDVAEGSPNLELTAVRRATPDILIVPHMYGLPVDLSKVGDIHIIEDCAQCLGARVRGVATGLQGKIGIFSFYATKLITSGGQGGMLVSRDKALVDYVRDYREFDCRRDRKHRFNFQMTDIQAAVGRAQLAKLPNMLRKRAVLFQIYAEAGLDLMDVDTLSGVYEPVRYRAVLKTTRPRALIDALAQNDIKAIIPIEKWELLGDNEDYPNAVRLTEITVSLPLFPSLTEEQASKIALYATGLQ